MTAGILLYIALYSVVRFFIDFLRVGISGKMRFVFYAGTAFKHGDFCGGSFILRKHQEERFEKNVYGFPFYFAWFFFLQ